ncbi:MAG: hypothetical protein ACRDAX_09715 [Propionibacteriaceae bacterium]
MPMSRDLSLLNDLWLTLPEGNPIDIEDKLASARVVEVLDALPPVTRDPLVPWTYQEPIQIALKNRDWAALAAIYGSVTSLERSYLLDIVLDNVEEGMTLDWREEAANDPVGMLVRARELERIAWSDKANAGKDGLTDFAAVSVETNLEWAAELCNEAAKFLPQDPTPWVIAQKTVIGDRDAVFAIAKKWQAIDEFHYFGNLGLLAMLSPKIVGNDDDRLGLARHLHTRAPQGNLAHLIICDALCDMYLSAVRDGSSPSEADQVFIDNIELIKSAYSATVASPTWQVNWLEGMVRNLFGFCFFFGDANDLAWQELLATQGHMMDIPWRLKGSLGVHHYQWARGWCVRHVVRP